VIATFFFSQVFGTQLYLVFGVALIGFWAVVYLYGRNQIQKKYNLDKILAKRQVGSLEKELLEKARTQFKGLLTSK